MELADVFVVNKADRPGTDDAVRDIEYMLDLGHPQADEPAPWRAPIVRAIATEGRGVDALIAALVAHHVELERTGELSARRGGRLDNEVRRHVRGAFEVALARELAADPELVAHMRARAFSPAEAARLLAARVLR
jgi:LAO/AO transport system kinase